MAINFLNSVNLNQNQLVKPRIENQPNDISAGAGVEGQLYYDTSLDVLKLYANGAWTALASASASGVTQFTGINNVGTFVSVSPSTTQTGAVSLSANLSATGTPTSSNFLRGDNTWATITSGPFNVAGNLGTPQSISPGETLSILGGTYITTTAGTLDTITISHNTTNQSNTTSTAAPAAGGFFTAIDAINTNTTGHVQGYTLKTVTLPLQTISLQGDVITTVNTGTTLLQTTINSGAVEFSMMDPLAIITSTETIAANNNDTTLPTSAAVKSYVDASLVGAVSFQGGYDALNNLPNLDVPPTITINKGFMWTVTADGVFFTEQVRIGDSLIANQNTPTTLAHWTRVQSNVDLASATTVGIGNVSAGNGISVNYSSGTATISASDFGIRGKKITLSGVGTGQTKVTAGGVTTFTINLVTAWAAGIEASNVACEVIDATTFLTVYAEIGRTSIASNLLTVAMSGIPTPVADNAYYVLLRNVE